MMKRQELAEAPKITSNDAVDEIVRVSKRRKNFGVRLGFVQRTVNGKKLPGPLADLVTAGDRRGLILYLLLLTKATAKPWNAALPAAAWARALGLLDPENKTARSTVSKIWLRLARLQLIRRGPRKERMADVFLLREDGQGDPYAELGATHDRYFKVPLSLWLSGPSGTDRWYLSLTLPELVVILIGRSLGDGFWLPAEKGPDWYGISADTISRGISGLQGRGLLDVKQLFKKAPLSPQGYTAEHRYTLLPPFGPVGRRSGSPAKKTAAAKPRPKKGQVREPNPTRPHTSKRSLNSIDADHGVARPRRTSKFTYGSK